MSPPPSPSARRHKSAAQRRNGLACTSDHGDVVEGDLEIIDLDPGHSMRQSPRVTQPPLRLIKCTGEPASDLREAESRLAALVQEAAALEERMKVEHQPCLEAASNVLEEKKAHLASLQKSMEACAPPVQNSSEIGGLTKLHLTELRQLTRCPPDHVRRTMIAVWLALHYDRFLGKTTVQVDEAHVWHLCKKMLGDSSFASRVQLFDPTILDGVPHLTLYIAKTYLGAQDPDSKACGDEALSLSRHSHQCLLEESMHGLPLRPSTSLPSLSLGTSPQGSLAGSLAGSSVRASASRPSTSYSTLALGRSSQKLGAHHQRGLGTDAWSTVRSTASQQKPSLQKQSGRQTDPWAAVHSGSCLDTIRTLGLSASRPSTGTCARPSSKFVVLAPLDLDEVHHASGPCGTLFHWLRELVLDRAKHARFQILVGFAKEELRAAEKAHSFAEQHMSDVRGSLEANQTEQSCQEQGIATLQQDIARLQHKLPTPTNASKVNAVIAKPRLERGKWLRPTFEFSTKLMLTMTTLQNTTWRSSCEQYKVLSPSHHVDAPLESGAKGFSLW